jgi:hypothetical protein
LKRRVPDQQGFPLESSEVSKAGKQERVQVLGIIWPRNKAPYKDVLLLVMHSRRQIQQHPDVDPARRQLLSIELGAVDRKHEDNVVLSDAAIFKRLYHIRAMENICILIQILLILEFRQDARSFFAEVMCARCTFGIPVQSLQLWTNGDGVEFLLGNPFPLAIGLRSGQVVTSLRADWTRLQFRKWPRIRHA